MHLVTSQFRRDVDVWCLRKRESKFLLHLRRPRAFRVTEHNFAVDKMSFFDMSSSSSKSKIINMAPTRLEDQGL